LPGVPEAQDRTAVNIATLPWGTGVFAISYPPNEQHKTVSSHSSSEIITDQVMILCISTLNYRCCWWRNACIIIAKAQHRFAKLTQILCSLLTWLLK